MKQKWYQIQIIPNDKQQENVPSEMEKSLIEELFDLAEKYYEKDVDKYEISYKKRDHDSRYLFKLSNSGTYSDKISSLVLLVQNSPLHSLKYLRLLNNMIKLPNRRISLMVIEVMRELYITELLPPNRKLRTFVQQPELPFLYDYYTRNIIAQPTNGKSLVKKTVPTKLTQETFESLLSILYFEHCLKRDVFSSFSLKLLTNFSSDQIQACKSAALLTLTQLLEYSPEGELSFLRCLVDKLADPDTKNGGLAAQCIRRVVTRHPNMKPAVLKEIKTLVFAKLLTNWNNKPSSREDTQGKIRERAILRIVTFVRSSFIMADKVKDSSLALEMVRMFFAIFKELLKRGEKNYPPKLMNSLFLGVNRAFPYLDPNDFSYGEIVQEIHIFFELANKMEFNNSIEILIFLYQVIFSEENESSQISNEDLNARYYKCLYRKVLDPQFKVSFKQDKLFNLLYKAIQRDTDLNRIKSFFKRLLTLCLSSPVPFTCGTLVILYEALEKLSSSQTASISHEDIFFPSRRCLTPDSDPVNDAAIVVPGGEKGIKKFDFGARDPRFAGDFEYFYEFYPLIKHFHPTVSLYANQLLVGKKLTYHGDPIRSFSLSNFLENFILKNPKSLSTTKHDDDATQETNATLADRIRMTKKSKRIKSFTNAPQAKRNKTSNEEARKPTDNDADDRIKTIFKSSSRKVMSFKKLSKIDFADDFVTGINKNNSKNKNKRRNSKSSDTD
ncbi:unnamed protein product [Gordionus sp. m RMFG-2023]|uniref:CCAAT/enhancer-binding protein zeta-like n=1 Tax=Gordionus sp. m RMFG-2023 TaxID=3053472 RepID=UPI0031FD34B1